MGTLLFNNRAARLLLILILFLLPAQARSADTQPMIEPHAQAMPLLPFLDYIVDETLGMDIEEVSRSTGWRPLGNMRLPREEGILWLRFTIAPIQPDAKPQTFLLDMGQSVPGNAALYEPVYNELAGTREWRENLPSQRNIILLPEATGEAQICFIRVNGLPGPWFAPMIRTPHNAATNWSSLVKPAAILVLGVVMLVCLLRSLSESGQWRYWTALFVVGAFFQAILGMPQALYKYTAWDLATILLPGITLMVLPHVGRHLMGTREHSRSIDIQLFLLSLPGAAMALIPLVPGWNWLDRWLELWPLGAVWFVPTALGAWMMGLTGSRRFLLACLVLPLFTGVALLGLEFGIPANILAALPSWGVAFAALILVAAAMHANKNRDTEKAESKKVPAMRLESEPVINLEHPLDDPNLRLIPAGTDELLNMPAPPAVARSVSQSPEAPIVEERPELIRASELREQAMLEPLDDIMRETAALTQGALPPSARRSVENLASATELLANIVSRPGIPPKGHEQEALPYGEEVFNLQKVMRNAHDAIASVTQYAGITLSWYMPPHLGPLFRGDGQRLENLLRMLLESAARATTHGAIKLSARRVPDSKDAGYILFAVEDEGEGYPPKSRSSLVLAKVWEFAGANGGYLSIECTRTGSTISFSSHFTPVDNVESASLAQERPSIALVASDRESRKQLRRIIESGGWQVLENDNGKDVNATQGNTPSPLLVAQGAFARPASGDMVKEFIRLARQAGFPKPNALAITPDQSQWRLLKTSGFTHAMLEPVDPEVLRRTLGRLLNANMPDDAMPGKGEDDNSLLFDERHSELTKGSAQPKAPASSEDKAPTMLIEQTFPLSTAFEGPEWLGKKDEPEAEALLELGTKASASVHASQDEAHESAVEPVVNHASAATASHSSRASAQSGQLEEKQVTQMNTEITAGKGQPDAQKTVDAPKTSGEGLQEWVGEPMPIGSPISEAAQKGMASHGHPYRDPGMADKGDAHTGGELLIDSGRKDQTNMGVKEDRQEDTEDSLIDFIDHANAREEKGDSAGGAANGGSSVKDFVSTSVTLVTDTLSNMLKNNSQKQNMTSEAKKDKDARVGNDVKPLDPVIVGLVARLDEGMDQARAAFSTGNSAAVATASSLISKEAEDFGLRNLARMAESLGRAARANNVNAMGELLLELGNAVEQNRSILARREEK